MHLAVPVDDAFQRFGESCMRIKLPLHVLYLRVLRALAGRPRPAFERLVERHVADAAAPEMSHQFDGAIERALDEIGHLPVHLHAD